MCVFFKILGTRIDLTLGAPSTALGRLCETCLRREPWAMDPYAGLPVCLLLAASFVAVGDGEALSSFFGEIHGAFLADFHGELWWRSCKVLGGS